MRRIFSCVFGVFLGLSGAAQGRFLTEDADRVDPEERLGTETYNDVLSYRYPVDWDRFWDAHATGYRVTAGSLTVNRFAYAEDIKVQAGRGEAVDFAFLQTRREDMLEQRTEREVRIGGRIGGGPARFALLGDGGTYKEYGDVGAAVGTKDLEAYVWSVDHFYETKKSDPGDEMTRKPVTYGLRGSLAPLRLRVEHDKPLRWHRPSHGYTYEYARDTLDWRIDAGPSFLSGTHERKTESKFWLVDEHKALRRKTDLAELGRTWRIDTDDVAAGLLYISRDAHYDQSDDNPEGKSPAASHRREGAAYATWEFPWLPTTHWLQLGVHANYVSLEENGPTRATEVKTQAAWDWRFDAHARLVLNTTWDIDQLTGDFPYRERPFRPWGGGNIQLVAAF